LADAPERVSGVATTEKPRKKITTVQIVHRHLVPIIIKTSLAGAQEHGTDVAQIKKLQKKTIKEATVALHQSTDVVMMEYQPNRVPAERLLCWTPKIH
jgi:hypothetical protein